jgi:hypothetical protein
MPLLALTVLVLPVIHDAAHRWRRHRRNLDQIELGLFGQLVGGGEAQDSDLLAACADYPDLRRRDLAVDSRFFFLSDVKPPVSSN